MKRFCIGLLFIAACGNPTDKKTFSNPSANNVSADVGISESDAGSDPTCGNGSVDEGEACDGNCPATCDDGNACTIDLSDGDSETCSLVCESVPVGCNNGDGCCPPSCTFDNDDDCSASCGDGIIDDGETCDGDCPTDCSVGDACIAGSLIGSANNCTAECTQTEVTACSGGDGCCPDNCDQTTDSDCAAECGNGVIETGETCDGNCPATCNDGVACTRDTMSGATNTCNVMCSNTTISACANSDGCCPAACDWTNDNDCPCTPMTCNQQGLECGQATNGCGVSVNCGGCAGNETCSNNQCVPNGNVGIGDPCADNNDCNSGLCATELDDFRQGYCTAGCRTNAECGAGNHCGYKDTNGDGFCLDTCTSDTQCRADGYLCFDGDEDLANECFPAGTGVGSVGSACNGSWECGGAELGWCALGWPNGYCTRTCGLLSFCPSGASCGLDNLSLTDGVCYDSCVTSADCRNGYVCDPLLGITGDGCVAP